jgi:hypothetical protein
MSDDKFTEKLETLKKTVSNIQSTRITKLPFWSDLKRGTPNSFIRSALFSAIQSKDRTFIKGETIFSQQGIDVKFTGEQLNQEDLTLWETLVHISKEQPLGDTIEFTAYRILKALNLNTGGDEHRRLQDGITRLNACSLKITNEGRTYFGALIKSGIKDELTGHYTIELNRELIRLYGDTQWTAIDWQQRLDLRRKPLAQALHTYYSSHKTPYPVKLETLQHLTGSKNIQQSSFKRQLRAALDALIKIGFLQNYSIVNDIVSVQRITTTLRCDT